MSNLQRFIGADPHDIIYYFDSDIEKLQDWPGFELLQNAGEYRYFNTSQTITEPNRRVQNIPGYVQPSRVWCIEPGGWAATDGNITIDLGDLVGSWNN